MREFKFRVWDKKYNKMITNFLQPNSKAFGQYRMALSFTGEIFAFTDWDMANYEEDEMNNTACYIDRFELMQYTGLRDSEGQEIYEGDYLRCKKYVGGNFVEHCYELGYVEFVHGAFGLHRKQGFYRPFKDWLEDYELEVIGNIYENQELLKEDTNG